MKYTLLESLFFFSSILIKDRNHSKNSSTINICVYEIILYPTYLNHVMISIYIAVIPSAKDYKQLIYTNKSCLIPYYTISSIS